MAACAAGARIPLLGDLPALLNVGFRQLEDVAVRRSRRQSYLAVVKRLLMGRRGPAPHLATVSHEVMTLSTEQVVLALRILPTPWVELQRQLCARPPPTTTPGPPEGATQQRLAFARSHPLPPNSVEEPRRRLSCARQYPMAPPAPEEALQPPLPGACPSPL